MALNDRVLTRLITLLSEAEKPSAPLPRLAGDARRLWKRVGDFVEMKLAGAQIDSEAIELACFALQLPMRENRRTNLRERCEQAAELMVSLLEKEADEKLLDRAARLLHEIPQKSPMLDEARLLADAVNLDDFGLTGTFNQAILSALAGEGIDAILGAARRREQYGYWEARLKDGFHYQPVREIAVRRLEEARSVLKSLQAEIE